MGVIEAAVARWEGQPGRAPSIAAYRRVGRRIGMSARRVQETAEGRFIPDVLQAADLARAVGLTLAAVAREVRRMAPAVDVRERRRRAATDETRGVRRKRDVVAVVHDDVPPVKMPWR